MEIFCFVIDELHALHDIFYSDVFTKFFRFWPDLVFECKFGCCEQSSYTMNQGGPAMIFLWFNLLIFLDLHFLDFSVLVAVLISMLYMIFFFCGCFILYSLEFS